MESTGPTCKHEFVRIYQRKLKGLERRLVATRAYLPVGFKMTDFGHLSEGSYCFCTKCRARLFPKRTAAEKAQARLQAQAKLAGQSTDGQESSVEQYASDYVDDAADETVEKDNRTVSIHVEELEIVPLELEELADGNAEIEESDGEDDA